MNAPFLTWKYYDFRVILGGQPHSGPNLGPEFNGDGTATVYRTVRATSPEYARQVLARWCPNMVSAELLEDTP